MWTLLLACSTVCLSSCTDLDLPFFSDEESERATPGPAGAEARTGPLRRSRIYLLEQRPDGSYEVVRSSGRSAPPPRGYLVPEAEFARLYRLARRGAEAAEE
jgi:hypothetical protein